MKTSYNSLLLLLVSFTAITLVSCSTTDTFDSLLTDIRSERLCAVTEEVNVISDNQSRSTMSSDNTFVWTKGDLVGVATTDGSTESIVPYKLSSGAGSSTGTFIGSINPKHSLNGKAVYPYRAQTTISGNTLSLFMPTEYDYTCYDTENFGDLNNGEVNSMQMPMWARIDGEKLHFEHLGGYFVFEISKIPAGSNRFEFTVKNKKKITGTFNVDLTAASPVYSSTVSNTENTVTFHFTARENPCKRVFCVPVPIGEYEYEWNIYNDNGELKGFGMSDGVKTISRKDVRIARRECSALNNEDPSDDSSEGNNDGFKIVNLTYNLSSDVWQEAKYIDDYVPSGATLEYTITSDVTVPSLRSGNHMTLWRYAIDETYISNGMTNYTLEKDVPFSGSIKTTVFHPSIPLLLRHTSLAQPVNITFKYRIIQGTGTSSYCYYEAKYPEEVNAVKELSQNPNTHLSFVHISDSHNAENNWSYADSFTDYIGADFLVHTGDILDDADISSKVVVGRVTSMQKPCYLIPGNHDYSVKSGSSTQANSTHFFNRFLSPTNAHNNLSTSKTYYSVVKNGVRSIFIDIYDDFTASIPGSAMATSVKMSKGQVEWLISELKAATAANQPVVIFTHCGYPSNESLAIKGWDDCCTKVGRSNGNSGSAFLLNMIDAFMDGTSYTFSHNGNSFTANFSGNGAFAGWFAGHEHSDSYGRIEGHERQWQCITAATAYRKTVAVKNFNGCCSWVMITPKERKVTIYRMGEQETTSGFMRDMITYNY